MRKSRESDDPPSSAVFDFLGVTRTRAIVPGPGLNKPETRSIVGPYLFLRLNRAFRSPIFVLASVRVCVYCVPCPRSLFRCARLCARDWIQPATPFSTRFRQIVDSSATCSDLAPHIKSAVIRFKVGLPKHLLK